MDSKTLNIIMDKLKGLEAKIKMSIPENLALIEHTVLFGRFKVKTRITYLDLKENWIGDDAGKV